METKTLEQQLAELKAGLETFSKEEIKNAVGKIENEIKAIETKADKTELEALKTALAEIKAAADANQPVIDAFVSSKKRDRIEPAETKSFNQILAETIERNQEAIRNYRPNGGELRFDMMPTEKKSAENEVKTVGDMSITVNFPGATALYQDVRGPLIQSTYNRTFIGDVLPQATSTGTQVTYPKENGVGEGGAAPWTDPATDKPQIDWDFVPVTVPFTWIAGTVTVTRDMLDDIPWMTSFIQQRMLISLKNAENTFILDGVGAIQGFQDVAAPYSGTQTLPVDIILDAAYGQIPDTTNEFYVGTHAIVRHRDMITKLGLNKASGSGEYNLPTGTVSFNNGNLQIAGLQVIGTTAIPANTYYAFDRNATTFIRRMQPELRMFEDVPYAKRNKILFRIEERVALVIYNNNAIVKGVLGAS